MISYEIPLQIIFMLHKWGRCCKDCQLVHQSLLRCILTLRKYMQYVVIPLVLMPLLYSSHICSLFVVLYYLNYTHIYNVCCPEDDVLFKHNLTMRSNRINTFTSFSMRDDALYRNALSIHHSWLINLV